MFKKQQQVRVRIAVVLDGKNKCKYQNHLRYIGIAMHINKLSYEQQV